MQIFRLSDEQAFDMFRDARWPETNGEAVCPQCGSCEKHYWLKTRSQWRCKDCSHTFSLTSGTIFSSHKMPLRNYLAAIAIFSNTAKGVSALQLSRDLDVQYKTAFVLAHKLRESLMNNNDEKLTGEVEIDACYVNQSVRPKNEKTDRVDRRLKENQNPKKRAVVVMRQRGEKGEGAVKTRTFLTMSENQKSAKALALGNISTDATIFADEHSSYDSLHANFKVKRIDHSKSYVDEHGTNTNQAESFFSRFRRMQLGQHHHMSNSYMDRYSNEAAYREDTRRTSNGEIFSDILSRCAQSGVSRDLCGYWQGNKSAELLAA